jgi:hypothetical protein
MEEIKIRQKIYDKIGEQKNRSYSIEKRTRGDFKFTVTKGVLLNG